MAKTMPKFKGKLVMVVGIVVFIGYMVIHRKVHVVSVNNAHLDLLRNDYAGSLQTRLTIVVTVKNGNVKAHATLSDITFNISYQGQDITVLVADPFELHIFSPFM